MKGRTRSHTASSKDNFFVSKFSFFVSNIKLNVVSKGETHTYSARSLLIWRNVPKEVRRTLESIYYVVLHAVLHIQYTPLATTNALKYCGWSTAVRYPHLEQLENGPFNWRRLREKARHFWCLWHSVRLFPNFGVSFFDDRLTKLEFKHWKRIF